MKRIPSLAELRFFVQSLGTEGTSDVPKRIDNEEDNWDSEGTVTVEEVATSGIRGKW